MALQVGNFCYADSQAAAVAACGGLPLTVGLSSGGLASSECVGVSASGALQIKAGSSPLPCPSTGCVWSYSVTEITPTYPPCWHGDLVDAGLLIIGCLLAAWAPCYGLWRLYKMMMFSRAEQS